eukprot:GCRY01001541.1.p1 GENE.GCRY01001541.1~~GCRY01001541.1.p1  ORF type:complete len:454 (+),score=102.04 GCRY01001541.1:166-1527(+)
MTATSPVRKVYIALGFFVVLFVVLSAANMKSSSRSIKTNHVEEHNKEEDEGLKTILEKLEHLEEEVESRREMMREMNALNSKLEKLESSITGEKVPVKEKIKPHNNDSPHGSMDIDEVIPIVMIACNRPEYLKRSMASLFKNRPSKEKYPIFLSVDCNDPAVAAVINKNFARDVFVIRQPDNKKHVAGKEGVPNWDNPLYFDIARHFQFAMKTIFDDYGYKQMVFVEDDCDVAPDFFNYFTATLPLLRNDPSLYCVSAFNDNGQGDHVKNPQTLERSDFHSGIGWMMTDSLWKEYRDIFPHGHWDDWMRMGEQRKGRQCIRPEVCRTYNFGKKGSSNGMWWEEYLASIKLNDEYVDFENTDLSYLDKATYDNEFISRVSSAKEVQLDDNIANAEGDHRILYRSNKEYEKIADKYHLMPDFWFGMPRVSYRGVVWVNLSKGMLYVVPASFPIQS